MKIFDLNSAILLGIFVFASAATPAFAFSLLLAPESPADTRDDESQGDWLFDSSDYTDNPKTGKRVWQYAKEKKDHVTAPYYLPGEVRYATSDPFFLPSTDRLFFMNTPDPFYAEPAGNFSSYYEDIGTERFFYGLDSGNYYLHY